MTTVIATSKKTTKPLKHAFLRDQSWLSLLPETDPQKTLHSGQVMAKAWAKEFQESDLHQIQRFIRQVLTAYWEAVHALPIKQRPLPALYAAIPGIKLDNSAIAVANAIGKAAAQLDVISAAYRLGNLYTSVLPETLRTRNGVFYTPPALTRRLIDMSTAAGVNWGTATVADPACGGGAFLAPVALKMADALKKKDPKIQLQHIETHLKGYEIDPFAAWLTQVFLEVSLKDLITQAGRRLPHMVTVCDTLMHPFPAGEQFDLVIGNPPYGKIKLTDPIRNAYKSSIYGHPNLYGLFTHLAINLVKPGGVIGYLTPTSFLSGEYFKNLRSLLRTQVTTIAIDFVAVRKGVFENVLQETMLATYQKPEKKKAKKESVRVNEILLLPGEQVKHLHNGTHQLPSVVSEPWILPRKPEQQQIVQAMSQMQCRLKDYGYKVSTGHLVWNRYKPQLTDQYSKGCYPVVWAESITPDGRFMLKAEKKNHTAWFNFQTGDEYLLTTKSCILLQRTTAKEQDKRLIAAVLPQSLLDKNKAVIIENHLNLIMPLSTTGTVISLEVLAAFLNSKAVNDAFRTISGSVAVSAYELEALPLPHPDQLAGLQALLKNKEGIELIEQECRNLYSVL